MSKKAKLRCCARCSWIYKKDSECPKCGFASYGARFVYGNKCYEYAKTQEPWLEEKVTAYRHKLLDEIKQEQIDIIADKVDKIFSRH